MYGPTLPTKESLLLKNQKQYICDLIESTKDDSSKILNLEQVSNDIKSGENDNNTGLHNDSEKGCEYAYPFGTQSSKSCDKVNNEVNLDDIGKDLENLAKEVSCNSKLSLF